MKATRLMIGVLLVAGLSGCLGAVRSPTSVPNATTAIAAPVPAAASSASGPENATGANHTGARELPFQVHLVEDVIIDMPPVCDPGKPWVCDIYYTGAANFTGDLVATGTLYGHTHIDTAQNALWDNVAWTVTGTLAAGCGSGTLTLTSTGYGTLDAAQPTAPLYLTGTFGLSPGSTSSGLWALVDIQDPDTKIHTQGTDYDFSATMWCL